MNLTADSPISPNRSGMVIKAVLVAVVVGGIVLAASYFNIQELLRRALAWISGLGPMGLLIFIALYILACLLLLPGSILTLGAGAIFGLVQGFVAVSIGAIIGATGAFLVGRYLARNWVAQRIAGNAKFKAVDEAVGREGWKIVLLTRLSPVFPFNLLNYSYGLTNVRLRHFFFASWLGMIPGTLMYVYLGSLAGDLANLGAGQATRTTAEWVLYGVGLMATVVVTVYVTRVARRALAERIER